MTRHRRSATNSSRALLVCAILLWGLGEATPLLAAAEEGSGGWLPLIARITNFAILVGALVYLLRRPVATYFQTRLTTIRKDLTEAATLRATAEQSLADVRQRAATLPAELEALRQRGREELASERARMKEATTRERERLLERTRREIDVQFRTARRELVEHTSDLAMRLARTRIERDITADDHARLIDRYVSEVRP